MPMTSYGTHCELQGACLEGNIYTKKSHLITQRPRSQELLNRVTTQNQGANSVLKSSTLSHRQPFPDQIGNSGLIGPLVSRTVAAFLLHIELRKTQILKYKVEKVVS